MTVEMVQAQLVVFDSEVEQTVARPQIQHIERIMDDVPLCTCPLRHMTGACDSRVQNTVKPQYIDRIADVLVVMQRQDRRCHSCETTLSTTIQTA